MPPPAGKRNSPSRFADYEDSSRLVSIRAFIQNHGVFSYSLVEVLISRLSSTGEAFRIKAVHVYHIIILR
jgi:hypothetical protein